MQVVMFCHSLLSDWNHGNAHFLRGTVTELMRRGHPVRVYEPQDGWSMRHLLADQGVDALRAVRRALPHLQSTQYELNRLNLDAALHDADLVIVHEWNDPQLIARLGEHRAAGGRYHLLFHDTHHRSVSDPAAMADYDLRHFDGVLAFGDTVRARYLEQGWTHAAWTWHEAADTHLFFPRVGESLEGDLVWVGNWGDEERAQEIQEFLIEPVKRLGLRAKVYGVRYPADAMQRLADAGIEYGGWLPNHRVPQVFSQYRVTMHIPRRYYAEQLRGIPTIRPFEAMACGIPLLCAPWHDNEHLFTADHDYLLVEDGRTMTQCLRELLSDADKCIALADHGLQAIRHRHTCAHRVDELLNIAARLGIDPEPSEPDLLSVVPRSITHD